MKKFKFLIIVIVLAIGVILAGCANQNDAASPKVTISPTHTPTLTQTPANNTPDNDLLPGDNNGTGGNGTVSPSPMPTVTGSPGVTGTATPGIIE